MRKPKAFYSQEDDAMMIVLSDAQGVESEEVADDVVLTFDDDNNVVLVEFVSGVREAFEDLIEKEVQARLRKRQKAS